MNYQEFLTNIRSQLAPRVADNVTLEIRSFSKNNGTSYDGLVLLRPECNIAPAIYLMPYYHRYLQGIDLEEICNDILATCKLHEPKEDFDTSCFTDFSQAKNQIVMRLVNFRQNEKLLKEIPFFRYQDLAIIFYYLLHADCDQQANILIHNHHLSLWGIDRDQLYTLAKENTPRLLPPQFLPMRSILKELQPYYEVPVSSPMPPLYILTNDFRTNGATALLYDHLLHEVAETLKKDLIILPSSIHEVLILGADPSDKDVLSRYTDMVREVNASHLRDEEVLSDHVYYYSRKDHIVSIPPVETGTDTPSGETAQRIFC